MENLNFTTEDEKTIKKKKNAGCLWQSLRLLSWLSYWQLSGLLLSIRHGKLCKVKWKALPFVFPA